MTDTSSPVRIGCSGWQYPDWRRRVYPAGMPARRWLAHYATIFDTVELNSTFYGLPSEATVAAWRNVAPDGFVFAWKLGAFGTHRKKLSEAATWLPRHEERARMLGATLGPTLVQLPPRWRRNAQRLDEMLSVASTDLEWAVELRDPSWLHDDVFEVLRRHHAALCIHDLLPDHPFVLTTDWTYIRCHGPHALQEPYVGRYGWRRLASLADRLGALAADGIGSYCYFNNDYDGAAVADGRALQRLLAR